MPKFTADLHIHSSFSRATGKSADLLNYAHFAGIKGINLLSTSDFTHPAWFKEIKEKLIESEAGIYRFKDDITLTNHAQLSDIRFMLSTEISSIYKKNDKVRKIHSLVFAPNIETAEKINKRLDKIGNIRSDGRPILGLDVKHLLETVLECSEDAFLVPAHIWTPWFSILGDKSGFDSVEEAFEELTPYIFALETGLSSDPEMNWRLSMLDRYTLISNSDAHSPAKLAREANLFNTDMNYYAIRKALETRKGFEGTIEFFPEEGKYHYDGHRNCGVRLNPEETLKLGNDLCPVCGKKLTIGVMHRVEELADRKKSKKPEDAPGFLSLIPLEEILSELTGSGVTSKTVQTVYEKIIRKFGNEIGFLVDSPLEDIQRELGEIMSTAIGRMRKGEVKTEAGYDGEFGKIYLFDEGELDSLSAQNSLFERKVNKRISERGKTFRIEKRIKSVSELEKKNIYSPEQEKIISTPGSLRIISGPGTGKTHTIIGRIQSLISRGVSFSEMLILTFTHKTRVELLKRIEELFPDFSDKLPVHTFHSLGYSILKQRKIIGKIIGEKEQTALLVKITGKNDKDCRKIGDALSFYRQTGVLPKDFIFNGIDALLKEYIDLKLQNQLTDIDDLVILPAAFLNQDITKIPYKYLFIDEFQDINSSQFEFCKPLFKAALETVVIGDPDQAIYTFRGAHSEYFKKIIEEIPGIHSLRLSASYRCPREILLPAVNVIENNSNRFAGSLASAIPDKGEIFYIQSQDAKEEAGYISQTIKNLIGAFELTGQETNDAGNYSFADFAILARSRILFTEIERALSEAGIPYTMGDKRDFESKAARYFYKDVLLTGIEDFFQRVLPDADLSEKKILDNIEIVLPHFEKTSGEGLMEEWEKEIFIYSARQADSLNSFFAEIEIALKGWSGHAHAEKVSLLTLHAAKGLEFPVVFIPGCDDNLLPYRLKGADNCSEEEERRLFYVGLTRSSHAVYLTGAKRRFIYGNLVEFEKSPFINEMKIKLNEKNAIRKKFKARKNQLELFG